MDGLSALSGAASVAQFIEFRCSLVSTSKDIYKSAAGASVQRVEVEYATKRLVELSERMRPQANREGVKDAALQRICDECISVSNELLSRLEKLKVQEGQKLRKYHSLRMALRSMWSKAAMDDITSRLNAFRKEMDAHMLASLRRVRIMPHIERGAC
jgi:hypothetical protein